MTNVIGTDTRTIGAKMEWFKNRLNTALTNGDMKETTCRDAMVLLDMIEMVKISNSCNHMTSRGKNIYGYERTPNNWRDIPTTVEQMSNNFAGSITAGKSTRVNETMSVAITDFMCLIDVAMMCENGSVEELDVVCASVVSGRHLGMLKFMFDILRRMTFKTKPVYLHILVNKEMYDTTSKLRMMIIDNVVVHESADWSSDVIRLKRNNNKRKMVVMMHNPTDPAEAAHLIEMKGVMVSVTVHMNIPNLSHTLIAMIRENGMVMEMALLSSPMMNTVRVRNAVWDPTGRRHITMYRQTVENTTSMILSLTNRIRPMNLNQMCFDCRMVHMMVTAMARAVKNRPDEVNDEAITHWSESFASTITIDETDYEAPI